jgi:predicted CXXCH cytochrome family protein
MMAIVLAVLCALLVAPWASADESVVNSKHDLSTFGPGPIRAIDESRICIFCHVPHNASPAAPLWNRYNPTTHYRIYASPTTDARIDQPGPASKLCLSCHDGSIALGLTLDRPLTSPIPLTHPFIPTGPSNLTNDLSDDHPIGLRYDRALANRDRQIRPPELVDHRIKLGTRGELECVACHEPHNNELGRFLRITEREGALCITCHDMDGWRTAAHALSPRTVPVTATNGEQLPYRSMADNACRSCHVSHSAPRRDRLLYDRPSRLCINCHDGFGARSVLPVIDQRSGHRINRLIEWRRAPEDRLRVARSVECSDCHNPHAAARNLRGGALLAGSDGPLVPPAMRHVPGVSLAGLPVSEARFYYEVCFRCHADRPVIVPDRIIRQRDATGNVRRQFLPTAASAHPVAFASRGIAEVPSLLPELRTRRLISCQDCHNNPDSVSAGGVQVNGPHGSRFDFLLVARYETRDFTIESPQSYALCYQCHDRTSILNDESFPFHSGHVLRGRSPCSACHTPHGVSGSTSQHSHLINFDISIVGGERFFVDTGRFSGSCTLTCHGVRHVNFTYGP